MSQRRLCRRRWASLACCLAERCCASGEADVNNAFVSHLILGHADGTWLEPIQAPDLHAAGLRGMGQVLGLGDTGVRTDSCSFRDSAEQVPFESLSNTHRKIAGYFSMSGDQQDSPTGHGTHIAGSMVGKSEEAAAGQPDNGMAPSARLVVVDVEKGSNPGIYGVPVNDIGHSYFDLFRNAEANIVCSPWSFNEHEALEMQVDMYVWNHPEFLPIFPSGNAFLPGEDLWSDSPCTAKNALCVGASYNARQMYLQQPSFVNSAIQLGSDSCWGARRETCAEELQALPALFGATAPKSGSLNDCESVAEGCLSAGAACPDCAFDARKLAAVRDAPASAASPSDACRPLAAFPSGQVCVAQRGTCSFSLKAKHCSEAGAVGVVIVNGATQTMTVMQPVPSESDGLSIPVVLVSNADGSRLLAPGQLLTFPVVAREVDPRRRVPYSCFSDSADSPPKPDIVMPGDGISSTAVAESCGFVHMSGTSQSCGITAGAAALVREYLQEWADTNLAKLPQASASTLKAALVAAAEVHPDADGKGSSVREPEVGFGLPSLATLLPLPPGTGLIAVQSEADRSATQRFCMSIDPSTSEPSVALSVSIAWTDPPDSSGRLVHDLDLEVSCDFDAWKVHLGNGGASADRNNNVEKVLLKGALTGQCVISVLALEVLPRLAQPFSLIAAGPFVWEPECRAAAAPACVHGVAEQLRSGNDASAPAWACRCQAPWTGIRCDEEPQSLTLSAQGASAPEVGGERRLRPRQWAYFTASPSCGGGDYEIVVEEATGKLQTALAWGHLEVVSLADSSAAAPAGVTFRAAKQASGRSTTITVQISEAAASAPDAQVSLAVHSQGRDGPLPYVLRWQPSASLASAGCGAAKGSKDAGSGLPTEQVILYLALGLAGLAVLVSTCVVVKRCYGRPRVYVDVEPGADNA
eukprot:TRINITY_DN94359_c0_g1_i1.p1 TRINITY_DN94359_c0_g1~~TRINITY_DN94359_c0_g1_i1.p1  ORF type:complete len:924 (-),score=177.40 TRINITY_DN94359_c0_g1_i1:91-2862(-)